MTVTIISPPTHQRSWLAAGTRLNHTYEIDRPIGTGGMGEIYKGHEIGTNHSVAIKLMLPEFAENESALSLFGREASALRQLQHEVIVRYYIFAIEHILQRPFLAMEFVEGRSLSAILEDDRPLALEPAHTLLQRVASGLQAAHERGIIHRDVSPDNIIIPNGDVSRAKLIDFGIARLTEFQESTIIGSGFAGKHNYVSPEQLGLFGGNVTAKSDIYSLGLVMVQALTGYALDMAGTQFEILEKRRRVPDLSGVDMRLRPLLEKMLQPDPDRRPESMAAVANWQLGSPTLLRNFRSAQVRGPLGRTTVPEPKPARHGLRYAATTLLLLGVLGGAIGGILYYRPQPPPLPEPPPNLNESPPPLQPPTPNPPSDIGPARLPNPPFQNREINTDNLRRYIEQYNGGDCFFISPAVVRPPFVEIDGFGTSTDVREKLGSAFKRDNGIEPGINWRQVTPAQCPAITFLASISGGAARAPKIELDNFNLRPNDLLTGLLSGFGTRNVELLLISDVGIVQNVSNQLKPGTDAMLFAIPMLHPQAGRGVQPQLLLAIAGQGRFPGLSAPGPIKADQFFAAVMSDTARARQPIAATAVAFMLDVR